MSALGQIERDISLMRSEVSNIKRDNTVFNKRIIDLEIFSQNTNDNYDNPVKCSKTTNNRIDLLQNENESLIVELTDVRSDHNKLQENYDNLKEDFLESNCRSMQENLLFFGIPEVRQQDLQGTQQLQDPTTQTEEVNGTENNANENKRENFRENTEDTLRKFMKAMLPLDSPGCVDSMAFYRVHRLGRPRKTPQAGPRPIVVKFERYTNREIIRKAGFEMNKNPRSKFKVREQFPEEIEDRRRNLYPVIFRFKQNRRNRVNLVRDKLYINGQEFDPSVDPQYCPALQRKTYEPRRGAMIAELPHQSIGITYIGRGARQKHNFYQPMKSYAQISGEKPGWLGRNFSASGQQRQVSPRRGQNVRTRPPETVRIPAVETRNYYGP